MSEINENVAENVVTKKITIGLSPIVFERLESLCRDKGLKRPSVIAEAINRLWKEENIDKK